MGPQYHLPRGHGGMLNLWRLDPKYFAQLNPWFKVEFSARRPNKPDAADEDSYNGRKLACQNFVYILNRRLPVGRALTVGQALACRPIRIVTHPLPPAHPLSRPSVLLQVLSYRIPRLGISAKSFGQTGGTLYASTEDNERSEVNAHRWCPSHLHPVAAKRDVVSESAKGLPGWRTKREKRKDESKRKEMVIYPYRSQTSIRSPNAWTVRLLS
ncbi:hypothetical protein B0H17DRAFT_1138713 [Mycena rosella]|uniref:Uncharacterized protein n=1 Tax=Mycena rosella TaxID=1033263 RepID=A0AAD7D5W2_MYCRO|nr:hypothetical protein B0H17DRAFT_1138713 [Mycena rosella]